LAGGVEVDADGARGCSVVERRPPLVPRLADES